MIQVDSVIRIPASVLTKRERTQIEAALSYDNPKYIAGMKRGKTCPREKVRGVWRAIPHYLEGFSWDGDTLIVPRGAIEVLRTYITRWPGIIDRRVIHEKVEIPDGNFALRSYQEEAVRSILGHMQGVIVIPAGGGKTVTALAAVARLKQPTLIIVHTVDLLQQWQDEIEDLLDTEPGHIQGKKAHLRSITVATIQTLGKMDLGRITDKFGCVILDEGHHAPASTFDAVVNQFPAKYRLALTATPKREDGLTDKLYHTFGPVLFEVSQEHLLNAGYLVPAHIHEVHTTFHFPYKGAADWPELLTALVTCEERNQQILDLLKDLYAEEDRRILVLSSRIEDHLKPLHRAAKQIGITGELLIGQVKKETRRLLRSSVRRGALRVLFASSVADEGLNIPELNTLLLTAPAKSESRVEQRVGRVMRALPGKTHGDVYDFVDSQVRHVGSDSQPLVRQYGKRKKAYHKLRAQFVSQTRAECPEVVLPPHLPVLRPPEILPTHPNHSRYLIGLDPSLTHFGMVAIRLEDWWPVAMQTVKTEKSSRKLGLRVADDDTRRLEILLHALREFLVTHPPALICCETPLGGALDANALKALSYAKCMVVAAKVLLDVPTVWLLPGEVKENVAGQLTSSKADVAHVVRSARSREGQLWAEAAWGHTKEMSEHQFDAAAAVLAARDTDLFRLALR